MKILAALGAEHARGKETSDRSKGLRDCGGWQKTGNLLRCSWAGKRPVGPLYQDPLYWHES